eukprot:CAMPEP_0174375146 /NCGR_PEP_ID=MMETSP0811_2-20130205/113495_1 /TAXON_ID=73025 ORGANISM="Eutreptiella gymnastica-like, Strain CCMP1594" /NCGR_SAMPLE_ID=MMETSP0811_2 /ASSEMBLY_ACC=CAM_ASM_000667 /LENGTH=88 /DNA_ID=CAMNT_0015525091 /DNA_START=21 /DNA_END=287 /DNA_ORIENTATION=+
MAPGMPPSPAHTSPAGGGPGARGAQSAGNDGYPRRGSGCLSSEWESMCLGPGVCVAFALSGLLARAFSLGVAALSGPSASLGGGPSVV